MKFHLYRDNSRKREWRWSLKSANGKTIANSGEGYKRKQGAKDAILLIQAYSASAPVKGVK